MLAAKIAASTRPIHVGAAAIRASGLWPGRGGAEQALDLEQIAIPQHGLERGHLRGGPHHGDTVVAGFLGKLADIDLEVLPAGLEVTPVGRVADQCLVALLELRLEAGDDRLAVGLVLLGLGVIAAEDDEPAIFNRRSPTPSPLNDPCTNAMRRLSWSVTGWPRHLVCVIIWREHFEEGGFMCRLLGRAIAHGDGV